MSVKDKGDRLVVKATPVPGEDIALELYAAAARTGLLDNVLDVGPSPRASARTCAASQRRRPMAVRPR